MSTHRYHEKAEGGLGQVLLGSLISSSGLLTMASQVSWCRRSNSPSMGHRMTFASLHYRGMIQKLTGCLDKSDAQLMLQELQPASLSSVPASGYFFLCEDAFFDWREAKANTFTRLLRHWSLLLWLLFIPSTLCRSLKRGFMITIGNVLLGIPVSHDVGFMLSL